MSPAPIARLALLALALLGCSRDPIVERAIPALEVGAYTSQVHPVVRFSCASLDCHGVPGRPLRIYAEEGLRARDELRDALLLTSEEARWNAAAFAGVDPDGAVDAHLALTKPLAVGAGGLWHGGGDVWPSRDDPGYRCVRAWIAGESARPESVQACAEAAAAVDPYPPDAGPRAASSISPDRARSSRARARLRRPTAPSRARWRDRG